MNGGERIGKSGGVAEHPRGWVRRLVGARGVGVPEKTLYWWSVHLERFLGYCRKAGPESSEILEVAIGEFLESIRGESEREKFAGEQARVALDVFADGVVNWGWGVDRFGRSGPTFCVKSGRRARAGRNWRAEGGGHGG